MNKEEKIYVSGDGTKTPLQVVETTHLINGLAKRYRDIFNSVDEEDFNTRLNDINDIKEEIYTRINKFHDEKLGDK